MSLRHMIASTTLVGSLCATVLPQTIFLEKYKELKAKYLPNQMEEPLHEKCKKLFEEVLDDIKLSEEERKLIRPFQAFGYNICSAGTLFRKQYGAIIGIPMNYLEENINAIDKFNITFNDNPVDWSKKSAKDFLKSITLSENAQKYAIAREVLKVKMRNLREEVLHLTFHIAVTFAIYSTCHKVFKVFQRSKFWRVLLGLSTITAGVVTWFPIKKAINFKLHSAIDEELSQLGPKYINGATEYYDKLLDRNLALKSLLNDTRKNPKVYDYENAFIWNRGATLSDRKAFFSLKNVQHT